MQGRFTKEEVHGAVDDLLRSAVEEKVISQDASNIFRLQLDICADIVANQTEEQWNAVPEGLTPEQLVIIVYLHMTDMATGSNYMDRLISSGQRNDEAIPSLSDLTDFQA